MVAAGANLCHMSRPISSISRIGDHRRGKACADHYGAKGRNVGRRKERRASEGTQGEGTWGQKDRAMRRDAY